MPGSHGSLWTQAGASNVKKWQCVTTNTAQYEQRRKEELAKFVHDELDAFEQNAGLISKKRALKMAAAEAEKRKKEAAELKKRMESPDWCEEDEDAGEIAKTSTAATRYVNLPLPQIQVYDFGAASVYPQSVKCFDTKIRERVFKTLYGPAKKTYSSAPFGGESTFCIQDTIMCRPNMNPIIPRGIVAEVPPLGRTKSQDWWQTLGDKNGKFNHKIHKKVHMNKAMLLRQQLKYRHHAQDELIKAMDEQYTWDCRKGNSWKVATNKYHKYLNSVEDNPIETPWWEKPIKDLDDDEKMALQIMGLVEDKIHSMQIRARDLFERFDTDHSGEVDPEEFQRGLRETLRVNGKPLDMSMDDCLKVMKLVDFEFDGVLSMKELDRTILAIGQHKVKSGERNRYTFDTNYSSQIAGQIVDTMALEADREQERRAAEELAQSGRDTSKDADAEAMLQAALLLQDLEDKEEIEAARKS